jgi:hypothetical protein
VVGGKESSLFQNEISNLEYQILKAIIQRKVKPFPHLFPKKLHSANKISAKSTRNKLNIDTSWKMASAEIIAAKTATKNAILKEV